MSKRNLVSIIVTVVVSVVLSVVFWSVSLTQAQSQELTDTQRIQNLEQDVASLKWSNMQLQAWSVGQYAAALYSTNEYRVVFEHDLSWRTAHYQGDISVFPYVCGLCRIGDYTHVTMYDLDGNIIDSYDFSSTIQPGDLLVAWYSTTQPVGFGPGTLNVDAYYWNKKTGLAVGFLKVDGSSKVNQ